MYGGQEELLVLFPSRPLGATVRGREKQEERRK